MSGSRMQVSYDEMARVAARLKQQRTAVHDELEEARRLISELVSSGFVTERASGRYEAASRTFVSGAQRTISALDDLAAYLSQTVQAMQRLDQELASRIRE